MNIDEQIKAELEKENQQLNKITPHNEGVFTLLAEAYKGALGVWLIITGIVTFIVTVIMIWAGYEFFFVEYDMMGKLHWAVVLLVTLMMQIALKMWTFMEMNRQSTLREIKRLELSLEQLKLRVSSQKND